MSEGTWPLSGTSWAPAAISHPNLAYSWGCGQSCDHPESSSSPSAKLDASGCPPPPGVPPAEHPSPSTLCAPEGSGSLGPGQGRDAEREAGDPNCSFPKVIRALGSLPVLPSVGPGFVRWGLGWHRARRLACLWHSSSRSLGKLCSGRSPGGGFSATPGGPILLKHQGNLRARLPPNSPARGLQGARCGQQGKDGAGSLLGSPKGLGEPGLQTTVSKEAWLPRVHPRPGSGGGVAPRVGRAGHRVGGTASGPRVCQPEWVLPREWGEPAAGGTGTEWPSPLGRASGQEPSG